MVIKKTSVNLQNLIAAYGEHAPKSQVEINEIATSFANNAPMPLLDYESDIDGKRYTYSIKVLTNLEDQECLIEATQWCLGRMKKQFGDDFNMKMLDLDAGREMIGDRKAVILLAKAIYHTSNKQRMFVKTDDLSAYFSSDAINKLLDVYLMAKEKYNPSPISISIMENLQGWIEALATCDDPNFFFQQLSYPSACQMILGMSKFIHSNSHLKDSLVTSALQNAESNQDISSSTLPQSDILKNSEHEEITPPKTEPVTIDKVRIRKQRKR
jgi:hypothetical protein